MSKKRILALALGALLLAGCSGFGPQAADASGTPAVSSAAASAAASAPAASGTPDSTAAQPVVGGMPLTGAALPEGAVSSRPVAVMVSNTMEASARQWGLADASVVVEALTEGKATNLMLWYDSIGAVPKTGPRTEGRDVFWQLALPQNSILVQKGMNLYAENLLNC